MDRHRATTTAAGRASQRPAGRPSGIQVLADAQRAGVTLTRNPTGTGINVDGPPAAGPLVADLRERGALLRHVFWVYTGIAPLLDWQNEHRATVIEPTRPCHLCGRPTSLLDPFDRRPCHKTCAETAIKPRPVPVARGRPAAA
ncbi:hypothetical protein [Phytohabitans aurantiacus]|uniref:Uncharacterized protein n=1 Tax=Phytohabitans aurantiacus TaxID=3016789 RepID=A0ABQ5QS74_9ACTN|nr:hypothetical protein [Phytohabitans aurantiacus]GLH97130.1 hypothetical protein Pa4123_24050 [Phytohabitans aurantiacus]